MNRVIIPIITLIIGGFINHIWERYKNRMVILNYEVWHQTLGLTADDTRFGSVKLLYNENPVNNLYMSTIRVRNETNKDIKDIRLNISSDPNSIILVSYGKNLSSINELSFTPEYQARVESGQQDLTLYKKRDYLVPVINREDTIEFSLLTSSSSPNYGRPSLFLNADYPGVKFSLAKPAQLLFGEPQASSAILGVFITLLICVPIIYYISDKMLAVLVAVFFSLFSVVWGVLIRKAIRQFLRLLS